MAQVIIVILVLALVTFPSQSVQSLSSTSSQSSQSPGTTTTFTSAPTGTGLEMRISLNGTVIPQGGAVNAQIDLTETPELQRFSLRPFPVNSKLFNWNGHNSYCGYSTVDHIFDYALFNGHYTSANISKQVHQSFLMRSFLEVVHTALTRTNTSRRSLFWPRPDLATSARTPQSKVRSRRPKSGCG